MIQLRAPVARADVRADPSAHGTDAVLAARLPRVSRRSARRPAGWAARRPRRVQPEPRTWRDDEVEALAALAANASVALANAELYQRLALEHAQSVAILSNVADGIVAVDREGRLVLWNAAAERITGIAAAEAIGRTPAEVMQRELDPSSAASTVSFRSCAAARRCGSRFPRP